MCELCGTNEEAKAGREKAARFAEQLQKLYYVYSKMSCGALKPHTDEMDAVGRIARPIIKNLVEEWI